MAIDYSKYPVLADVTLLLTSSGITVPGTFDATSYLDSAIVDWEKDTHYQPFLAGASESRYYDPPGPNFRGEARGGGKSLFLDRGFVSISAIHTGITPTDSVGDLLTADVDYRVMPYNAAADLVPITQIDFVATQWGSPKSIKITGIPGYAVLLPAPVWRAIRDQAASDAAKALKEGISSGTIEWSEADVHKRKSIELLANLGSTWAKSAAKTRTQYTLSL